MPHVVFIDLPYKVYGASGVDAEGYQTIYLNARCSMERCMKAFLHEWGHRDDFGLDINVDQLEAIRHNQDA